MKAFSKFYFSSKHFDKIMLVKIMLYMLILLLNFTFHIKPVIHEPFPNFNAS